MKEIFKMQADLLWSYQNIEVGLGTELFSSEQIEAKLNNPRDQLGMKFLAWCIVEELTEASIDLKLHEELIDALHFFVELCLRTGVTPDTLHVIAVNDGYAIGTGELLDTLTNHRTLINDPLINDHRTIIYEFYHVIELLGKAMNMLKNKPWTRTQKLTDKNAFEERIARAFIAFLFMLGHAGLRGEKIRETYRAKHAVNVQRQRDDHP